jgi:hypothetical protein
MGKVADGMATPKMITQICFDIAIFRNAQVAV